MVIQFGLILFAAAKRGCARSYDALEILAKNQFGGRYKI